MSSQRLQKICQQTNESSKSPKSALIKESLAPLKASVEYKVRHFRWIEFGDGSGRNTRYVVIVAT